MLEEGVGDDARRRAGRNLLPRHARICWASSASPSSAPGGDADGEEERAEGEGWAYFADEVGELHPCCPGCLGERFGITGTLRSAARVGALESTRKAG